MKRAKLVAGVVVLVLVVAMAAAFLAASGYARRS